MAGDAICVLCCLIGQTLTHMQVWGGHKAAQWVMLPQDIKRWNTAAKHLPFAGKQGGYESQSLHVTYCFGNISNEPKSVIHDSCKCTDTEIKVIHKWLINAFNVLIAGRTNTEKAVYLSTLFVSHWVNTHWQSDYSNTVCHHPDGTDMLNSDSLMSSEASRITNVQLHTRSNQSLLLLPTHTEVCRTWNTAGASCSVLYDPWRTVAVW